MNHNYCVLVSLPAPTHKYADMGLSAILLAGPILAPLLAEANQWLAFFGGLVGLALGSVRLYRIWYGRGKDEE